MAGDNRNTHLRTPRPFLPDVPLDLPGNLQNLLIAVRGRLEALYVDPSIPGQPTNFSASLNSAGVELKWDLAPNTWATAVYVSSTNVFTEAEPIQVLRQPVHRYTDPAGQYLGATTLYYWVRGVNAADYEGPLSLMRSVENPAVAGSGGSEAVDSFACSTLGDGRHGAISITSNTTATVEVPIYQVTSLNVAVGATWTAFAGNPGGFFIKCQGRATIAGTISVAGRGGLGGGATTSAGGLSGDAGFNFAGSGGSGGAAPTNDGGYGGPVRGGTLLGGPDYGQVSTTDAATQWDAETGSPTKGNLSSRSSYYLIGAASAPTGASGAGTAGINFTTACNADLFNVLWTLYHQHILGWGSGGGSGGIDGGGSNGLGGNGGGFFWLECDELDFTGTINASGANGTNAGSGGGGGGGGGGMAVIGYRSLIANSGTVTVAGGTAGTGSTGGNGAAGGSGFSKVFDMRI